MIQNGRSLLPPRARPPANRLFQTFAGKPLIFAHKAWSVKNGIDERSGYEFNHCLIFLFIEKIVDFAIIVEHFFFYFFWRCEKLGGVVQFGENLIIQVEIFIPDVGQRCLQRRLLTQGLDFLPATILTMRSFFDSLDDSTDPPPSSEGVFRDSLRAILCLCPALAFLSWAQPKPPGFNCNRNRNAYISKLVFCKDIFFWWIQTLKRKCITSPSLTM